MSGNQRSGRKGKSGMAGAAANHEGTRPSVALPIPDTCAGGMRVVGSDSVECLGTIFHCEYLTAIEDRWFCHHPQSLEIVARTVAARREAAKRAAPLPLTDMSSRLGKS